MIRPSAESVVLAVPAAGPGRCTACRGPVATGYVLCWCCAAQRRTLGNGCADAVLPAALAPKGSALARALWRYKALPPARSVAERRLLTALLGAVLAGHEGCLAAAAGALRFDRVCVVPSARGRCGHPLTEVLLAAAPGLHGRLARFADVRRQRPAGALLCDDTWTTGWHAQQASAALKRAGVRRVGVLVVGRHLAAAPPAAQAWSADRCALEAPRRPATATAGSAPPG
jgi:hypothetical protein